MRIRNRKLLEKFAVKHADIANPLQHWIDVIEEAEWKSHADCKLSFPSADYVGKGRYVFNIKGNSYRLVVVIVFVANVLTINFIGTHAEYDKLVL